MPRPLPPEVLVDAWADVTGVPNRFGDEPAGTRAIALADPATTSRALDLLGRCDRKQPCAAGASGPGLPALLHRINGDVLNAKLTAPEGRLRRLFDAGRSDHEILTEFFLCSVARPPTEAERQLLAGQSGTDRLTQLEDAVWALLNSHEFTTNH
jgi:hypothetical protein